MLPAFHCHAQVCVYVCIYVYTRTHTHVYVFEVYCLTTPSVSNFLCVVDRRMIEYGGLVERLQGEREVV